jgi:predicted ATPase
MSQARSDPSTTGPVGVTPNEPARWVETALERLHDIPYLQRHPLAARLREREPALRGEAAGRALQRVLLEAVEALRSAPGPSGPSAGRAHEVLMRRYVEGEDVATACRALGVHERTLYRAQAAGLAAVAGLLRERWAPPPRDEPCPPTNLPAPLTSFVGRARDLDAVGALLSHARLVTLTGAGGVGKTRLALEVVRRQTGSHHGGVWFVDLAPLADPALVGRAVAAALGVREVAGQPLEETLIQRLREGAALLLLDNCEHLVGACAGLVAALLGGCPRLRVLATSRELLGLTGEAAWRVPSLELPAADGRPEEVAECEAVRLFLERARLARPDLALTARNAPVVAQLCRRLDGIPLALELAAARTRVLGVEEIAARLDDRFRVLTGGERVALPRHRTLRAAVDWSHDLLAEAERALLRRLAVFAGGWTLEAAEAVCGPDVLDGLGQLVDRSLVLFEQQGGDGRYRLLETIRQYAWERLVEAGEDAELRDRHRKWCLALAQRAARELFGVDAGDGKRRAVAHWLRRFELEHDNLRAALEWTRQDGRAELGLRIAADLWGYWLVGGYFTEARARYEALLALPAPAGPTRARARSLVGAGVMHGELGDFDRARARCQEGLALARSLADPGELGWALVHAGVVAEYRSDTADARACYEESLAAYSAAGDRWGVALLTAYLARIALAEGRLEEARTRLEPALPLARALGDDWIIAHVLTSLGKLAHRSGQPAEAASWTREALSHWRALQARQMIADCMLDLGRVAVASGDWAGARRLCGEGLELYRAVARWHSMPRVLADFARLAVARGHDRRGLVLLGAAAALQAGFGVDTTSRRWQDIAEPQLSISRERLGDQAAEAWRRGEGMTLDQAIAYALADEDEDGAEPDDRRAPEPAGASEAGPDGRAAGASRPGQRGR